jgi:hypothetical protein
LNGTKLSRIRDGFCLEGVKTVQPGVSTHKR